MEDMNTTMNQIINSIHQSINEEIINDMIEVGYSHDIAVKMVTEFEDFDLAADAEAFPVTDF